MTLRAVVFGVGHLGRHHARILSELAGVELTAIIDPDEARGREHAVKYSSNWFADLSSFQISHKGPLSDAIDFAVIAVPTTLHEACATPLLLDGVACLVEKPMAPDPETCARLVAAAEKSGAILGVGHVERFNPAVRRALELGVRPRFIEAHRLAPYTFRSTDVGVVLDLMIHDIDLALAWVGSDVVSVDAVGGATLSPSEDIASVRLRFENGAVANLTASRLSLKPMRRFRVFGPDCYVSVDSQDRYALLVQKGEGFDARLAAQLASAGNPSGAFSDMLHVEELQLDEDEPLRAELESFAKSVQENRPHLVTGEDGMRAVETAFRIQAALAESGWQA
ncbi:MAG: Gfo/Idh/MocA family oxidoreductase [Planctomycetes bacterium]|jgi:predicted dehydrogenase|nr:Gfo/Idh/MocA family oxidoreductase [Planctomycetota bacterium]MBT4028867.1 Gfo/Idh/MocA family oxidoreductase [Planctomycetota bacterium]MBT4559573.1 Gfo/Idh/MocA family oxidoreductase [Planctomycetota bacterium]MBT5100315.1 Gfo/Idh/MocA family oxidoreductase [Planctomycetota bacterium]MBT5119398.1 Gfo/Idh/MocA family oxidoreductase [Planctomycetota bacterium]